MGILDKFRSVITHHFLLVFWLFSFPNFAGADVFYTVMNTNVRPEGSAEDTYFNVVTRHTWFWFAAPNECEEHLIKTLKTEKGWSMVPRAGDVKVKLIRYSGIETLECVRTVRLGK